MTSPENRVFTRLILSAAALSGLLILIALELLILGAGNSHADVADLRCVVTPVSKLDIVVHALAVSASAVTGIGVMAGLRAISRAWTRESELRSAMMNARLSALPMRIVGCAFQAGVTDRVDIVDATRPFAFAYGWMQPRICVSTGLINQLTEQEIEAVLHHERWHVARRDPLRFLIAHVVEAAFAVVPPIRNLVRLYMLAAEVAADCYVVAEMGHPRSLAGALIKTMGATHVEPAFGGQVDARIAVLAGEPLTIAPGGGLIIAILILVELIALVPLLANGSLIALVGFWTHPVC